MSDQEEWLKGIPESNISRYTPDPEEIVTVWAWIVGEKYIYEKSIRDGSKYGEGCIIAGYEFEEVYKPGDWFWTKEEAFAEANRRKMKKIEKLEKKIEALRAQEIQALADVIQAAEKSEEPS